MEDEGARGQATVNLVPMTPEIYDAWVGRTIVEYAAGHVEAGNWTAEEAPGRAKAQFDELLPNGLESEGQHLWSIRDADDRHVGILWVAPWERHPNGVFIYDIAIEPAARGRGLGRAALEALHDWARQQGYSRVGLHVFGSNDVARRLYLRTGYVETDVRMEKRL